MRTLIVLLASLSLPAQATPSRVQAAVAELQQKNPRVVVSWPEGRATPWMINNLDLAIPGADATAQAAAFLQAQGDLLALDGAPQVLKATTRRDRTTVRFQATYGGVPIVDRSLVVRVQDGRVRSVVNEAPPLREVLAATIGVDQAREVVQTAYGLEPAPQYRKVVVATGDLGVEAYEFDVLVNPLQTHLLVRVDAHRGVLLGAQNRVVK